MKLRFAVAAVVVSLLAVGCVSTVEQRQAPKIPILPYDISELSNPVERLAFQIYARDIAAWRATDTAIDSGLDLEAEGVRGWITVLKGSDALVRFVSDGSSGPLASIDVSLDLASSNPGILTRHSAEVSLSETESSMWRARQLAVSSDFRTCSDRYNTVVLRDSDSENWLVYLLASTQRSDLVVGGHHRFLVSPLGDRILETTALSMSCLTAPHNPKSEMFVFTQNASEEPLETSVLLSLQFKLPIMFRVPHGSVWMATQGRLRQVREGPGE